MKMSLKIYVSLTHGQSLLVLGGRNADSAVETLCPERGPRGGCDPGICRLPGRRSERRCCGRRRFALLKTGPWDTHRGCLGPRLRAGLPDCHRVRRACHMDIAAPARGAGILFSPVGDGGCAPGCRAAECMAPHGAGEVTAGHRSRVLIGGQPTPRRATWGCSGRTAGSQGPWPVDPCGGPGSHGRWCLRRSTGRQGRDPLFRDEQGPRLVPRTRRGPGPCPRERSQGVPEGTLVRWPHRSFPHPSPAPHRAHQPQRGA